MANQANKLEKNLSAEDLQAFIRELAEQSANPTLAAIQKLAENYDIKISHESARSFKKKNFQRFLDKISGARERAEVLSNAITGQEEGDIAAGVGILITEQITDLLMQDRDDGYTPKDLESLSKALNLLRSSNQNERILEARLKEFEAKQEEREAKKAELEAKKKKALSKGGVSEETLAIIEEAIGLL